MKKRVINLTLFIATVLIGMNSCTNRKASVTEDVYNISSQDTAVVLKLDYTLESFRFSQYTGNEVKFRVKFAEEDAADNKPAAYTSLRFCPVKYNADWYLTIESE